MAKNEDLKVFRIEIETERFWFVAPTAQRAMDILVEVHGPDAIHEPRTFEMKDVEEVVVKYEDPLSLSEVPDGARIVKGIGGFVITATAAQWKTLGETMIGSTVDSSI